ncbi:hypothetical protein TeGR_g12551 [Tetraparma gracilis]|uniref:Nascent polypeptide-associated complex subunit alpha-like UBA domain-containing protein n=1 Tax=Tetraparma gracilis TaxID=2962635 RepID=A0ABQ6MR27_9STRA|nr:hypothetical protein TeGR_g12551 [Tetraparma gracilis]
MPKKRSADSGGSLAQAGLDDGEPSRGGKKKKSKVLVMDETGQTDGERRALRRQQRTLANEIQADGAEMEDAQKGAFKAKRDKNNELFADVNYAREAVMDGENLAMIAKRASKQATKLVAAQTYDIERVIKTLKRKCSYENGGFDWLTLGGE